MSAQSAAQASLGRGTDWHCGQAGHPITLTQDAEVARCVCGAHELRRTDTGYQYEFPAEAARNNKEA